MNKATEKAFEKITQDTSSAAGEVKCLKADYKEGLSIIISDLEMALEAVTEELENEAADAAEGGEEE